MIPRIFVTGTGRSGTWILYKSLGCHKDVHIFPSEMRFLIDPDGLRDLIDALTIRYHPEQASEALNRFERLMYVYLATPQRAPFASFDFPGWLGEEYYWQRLDQFCSELVEFEFDGFSWRVGSESEGRLVDYARRLQRLRRHLQGKPSIRYKPTLPRKTLKETKYFSDRQDLIALCADFVDDLFLHAARANGKRTWCEKTPQHLLALDFLWELFPEAVVIHIKRDPRGVVHSLTKQRWAPDDVKAASIWLRNIYDRWYDLKHTLDLSRYRYHELKLEDLAASPHTVLKEISAFCGLEHCFEGLPDITLERVEYWRAKMSRHDVQLVNNMLGSHITWLGYKL